MPGLNPDGLGRTARLSNTGVESLSTENLNNEYYASNFAGSNGREKIQNAIDTAAASPSGGTVIIDGRGPDDVSDSSGAIADALLAENAWELDSHLTIPSLVTVKAVSCYVFLADGADDNLIRTAGVSGEQTARWALLGENAIFDGNGENQTTFDRNNDPDAIKNLGIRITNAREFTVSGIQMRNTNGWAIRAEQIEDAIFSDLQFQQLSTFENTDGLNIIGPAENFIVTDIEGLTDDDMIGIKCGDPDLFLDGDGGDVRRFSVSDIVHESAGGGAHAVRLLRGATNASLEYGVLDNIISTDGNGAVEFGFVEVTGNKSDFQYISLNNIQSFGAPAVDINEDVRRINITNVNTNVDPITIRSSCDYINVSGITQVGGNAPIVLTDGASVFSLSVSDIMCDGTNGVFEMNGGSVLGLSLAHIRGKSPAGPVVDIDSGASVEVGHVTDVDMRNCNTLFNVKGSFEGRADNCYSETYVNQPYADLSGATIVFGQRMPAFDSAPSNVLHSFVRASPNWDPDGDGNGEWVVSDGTAWQEVVDLPNWT